MPVAAMLMAATLLDAAGNEAFSTVQAAEEAQGAASVRLLHFLDQANILNADSGLCTPSYYDIGISLYGFFVRDRLRVIYLDALRYRAVTGQSVDIKPGLWYHPAFQNGPWADPYDILVPSEQRKDDVDRAALCDFLGIPFPADWATNPRAQAEVVRQMALKGQLFHVGA